MSFGLQTLNSSGVVDVDISSRLCRFVGTYVFSTTFDGVQYINVPGLTTDGTWFTTNVGRGGSVSLIANYVLVEAGAYYNGADSITVFRM